MSQLKAKLLPLWYFCKLYISIFKEGGVKDWRRILRIGILDFASVFSATSTMIIVAVIVTGTNKGNFLNTLNQVLKYVNLEIANQKSAQLFVLVCGGILSAGLILFSAISRFLAASNGRDIARTYHKELIYEFFELFEGIKTVPDLPSIERGGDLNIAVIQDTIHASKALETLLRLPQVVIFSFVLMVVAFSMQAGAMIALIIACFIGLPVVVWTGRKIQTASEGFFEKNSQKFGGSIANILNGFETCATPYPQVKVKVDKDYIEIEKNYFTSFDSVQLSSDRMNLAASFVRALGFGTAFVYVSSLVVIQEADITTVIAFATIIYLFVSQLQNLFGSLSTLVVFYPQVKRLLSVRKQLYAEQDSNEKLKKTKKDYHRNFVKSHVSLSTDVNSDNSTEILGTPIVQGKVFNVVVSNMPGKFNLIKEIHKINITLKEPICVNDIAYFRSSNHNFPDTTLTDIDKNLYRQSLPSLKELSEGLGIFDLFTEWSLGLKELSPNLSLATFSSAPGQVQGLIVLAISLCSKRVHLFLDRTYIVRFHGAFRDYAISLFSSHLLWLMSASDILEPVKNESLKINLRTEEPEWTFIENVLENVISSEQVIGDNTIGIIV